MYQDSEDMSVENERRNSFKELLELSFGKRGCASVGASCDNYVCCSQNCGGRSDGRRTAFCAWASSSNNPFNSDRDDVVGLGVLGPAGSIAPGNRCICCSSVVNTGVKYNDPNRRRLGGRNCMKS